MKDRAAPSAWLAAALVSACGGAGSSDGTQPAATEWSSLSTDAGAATVPLGSPVKLIAQNSAKCVDIVGGYATQETCGTALTQQWTFRTVTGGYQIVSVATPTLCLLIPGGSSMPSQIATVAACSSGGAPGDIWNPEAVGSDYNLVNAASGQCLDVDGDSSSNNVSLDQWTCSGQSNQLFALGTPPGGTGTPTADAGTPATDASTPTADAAQYASVPTQTAVTLIAQNSSKCIDIVTGDATQETCGTALTQQWTFTAVNGGYQIVSVASPTLCLLIPGGSSMPSQIATVAACSSGGAPGDVWSPEAVGSNYNFVNNSSGQCLDVDGDSSSSNVSLDQWTCNGQTNQLFALGTPPSSLPPPPADAGTPTTDGGASLVPLGSAVTITSNNGGNCLGITAGAGMMQACSGVGSQQWAFKPVAGGYQIVTAGNSTVCLNFPGGSTTPSQVTTVSTCSATGVAGEVWTPVASGSGTTFVNDTSGQCLDVYGASPSAGAAVDQWQCNGQPNQAWTITVLGPAPNPAVNGQWSQVLASPSITVAAAMTPSGKIMTWASWAPDNWSLTSGLPQTYTSIIDPQAMTATEVLVTQTSHDMFCPGTAMLGDGRLFVNGGGMDVANTSIYDSIANTWVSDALMNEGRWYNVSVTLPSGLVFTLGGNRISGLDGTGEIWTPGVGWQFVPNALMAPLTTTDPSNRSQEHPRLFVAPNGKIFVPGPNPNMFWYDLSGNGTITPAGPRGDDVFSQNDATVMFDVGKILKAGGNTNYDWSTPPYNAATTPSSSNAYVIDINGGGTAQVTKVAPLNHGRCFATPVVLPDGTVMVSGGLNNGKAFTDTGAVFPPELYNPTTQTWQDLPPLWVPRTYHSVALLIPDGRVFVGGGGLCGPGCLDNHSDFQFYSPAYLFQPGRPSITGAPTSASWGSTFPVTTTGTVTGFSWVRMSSTTHTVNTDQRWMAAQATAGQGGAFTVNAPANGNVAPPGYYMLFALNGGVPSVAAIIKLGP